MKLSQVKEYVTGVLKQWFTNKPILDKFNETETGELLYGTKAISSNPVLKYQKYLNTELDSCFCMLSADYTPVVGEYVPFIKKSGSFEVNEGRITIKPGQRAQINISVAYGSSIGSYGNIKYAIKDYTNNILITQFRPINNDGYNEYPEAVCCQYTNETDVNCEIGLYVSEVKVSDTIRCYYTSLTVHEIGRQMIIDPVEHINTEQGLEDTPVGHIISHMGNSAPTHYLICDGAEYNIEEYPDLAQHFINEFGSVNCFGGDGITTFAVPSKNVNFVKIPITDIDSIFVDSLYSAKFPGEYAFDGVLSTSWAASASSSAHYIGYDFKKPTRLAAYSITIRNYNTSDITESPAKWTLQGSNDGNEWVNITEQLFSFTKKEQVQIFELASPVTYSQYRLYNIIPSSGSVVSIGELDFYTIKEVSCIKYEPTYFMTTIQQINTDPELQQIISQLELILDDINGEVV